MTYGIKPSTYLQLRRQPTGKTELTQGKSKASQEPLQFKTGTNYSRHGKIRDNMSIELYTEWAKKQLEDNNYYVETNGKGGLTFSLTNRVGGLEGFYCDLTRDELVYQYENSDDEILKDIETEMTNIFKSNETKLRQFLENKYN